MDNDDLFEADDLKVVAEVFRLLLNWDEDNHRKTYGEIDDYEQQDRRNAAISGSLAG